MDTWWQTETGSIMISPLPGLTTTKPGSATFPLPGIDADVVDEAGNSVPLGGGATWCSSLPGPPWPGPYTETRRGMRMFTGGASARTSISAGDGCKRDEEGYFWLLGRVDDVMNISGHRLSTMEVESALVDHQEVAEAAVIGKKDDIKGEAIAAFVTLKEGAEGDAGKVDELKKHVVRKIGPIARPQSLYFTAELPKTRSGKIMRRLLRDIAEGRALGDTTTLADATVVAKLKSQYEDG